MSGAQVMAPGGRLLGRTREDGSATVACALPCPLRIEAEGFAPREISATTAVTVLLEPAPNRTDITVTAYRTPMGVLESPVATRLLARDALFESGSVTLDGQMRQLPGVELFRRSSSLNANPSSQGVSLRGLGSSSASRTLVTREDVPLNDPVGGWIHWQEQPQLSIASVETVRGGASDLYGSSAIGGVINMQTERPGQSEMRLRESYGGMGTHSSSVLGQTRHGAWGVLASGDVIGTDGFIQLSPAQRGPVDRRSNVHSQNGEILVERDRNSVRAFSSLNGFNESRGNGTAYQANGTRLWRYTLGLDAQGRGGAATGMRLFGTSEHFRQTFSNISNSPVYGNPDCTARCGEIPKQFSRVPDNELGGSVHRNQPVGAQFLLVMGGDVRDIRVWDREQVFTNGGATTNLGVHQRTTGVYAEAMWVHGPWTWTASGRMDFFSTFDQRQFLWDGARWDPLPALPTPTSAKPFDPRMGLSRRLGQHWALSATGFRAFRAPTPNELYRSTQVGNKLTNPNGALESERATGWETGVASEWKWGVVRTSYFSTLVNRPITAVTVNLHTSPILLLRENLGQLTSRGVAVDFEWKPLGWLAMDGGYQYAHATVTEGTQDLRNWIPEVARNMTSLGLRAYKPRWGLLRLQGRMSGRQYDDDANLFPIHSYARLDAYASREVRRRVELFAAGENLLDRRIEVAKTPTTTLASPRTVRAGLALRLGGAPGK